MTHHAFNTHWIIFIAHWRNIMLLMSRALNDSIPLTTKYSDEKHCCVMPGPRTKDHHYPFIYSMITSNCLKMLYEELSGAQWEILKSWFYFRHNTKLGASDGTSYSVLTKTSICNVIFDSLMTGPDLFHTHTSCFHKPWKTNVLYDFDNVLSLLCITHLNCRMKESSFQGGVQRDGLSRKWYQSIAVPLTRGHREFYKFLSKVSPQFSF